MCLWLTQPYFNLVSDFLDWKDLIILESVCVKLLKLSYKRYNFIFSKYKNIGVGKPGTIKNSFKYIAHQINKGEFILAHKLRIPSVKIYRVNPLEVFNELYNNSCLMYEETMERKMSLKLLRYNITPIKNFMRLILPTIDNIVGRMNRYSHINHLVVFPDELIILEWWICLIVLNINQFNVILTHILSYPRYKEILYPYTLSNLYHIPIWKFLYSTPYFEPIDFYIKNIIVNYKK